MNNENLVKPPQADDNAALHPVILSDILDWDLGGCYSPPASQASSSLLVHSNILALAESRPGLNVTCHVRPRMRNLNHFLRYRFDKQRKEGLVREFLRRCRLLRCSLRQPTGVKWHYPPSSANILSLAREFDHLSDFNSVSSLRKLPHHVHDPPIARLNLTIVLGGILRTYRRTRITPAFNRRGRIFCLGTPGLSKPLDFCPGNRYYDPGSTTDEAPRALDRGEYPACTPP
ncbi:hypothetical protein T265_02057 [Opisthorchis viverrini]|uniref:Uncharacterized protein n=1 Tax=Opisthorchis viverrini TaxID=6198 RepID=A0A074ZXK7_OPIVI|nr:hypothetical protein T265_02057 [Opisthorchis viverrini]KER31831.1 hypothetical protein T265_02057 [Opisthorchis viverrini]